MASNYFPDDIPAKKIAVIPAVSIQQRESDDQSNRLQFPLHRTVLWDRSHLHLQSKLSILAEKVLPLLVLPTASIREILTNCSNVSSFDQYVQVYPINTLKTNDQLITLLERPLKLTASTGYAMQLEDHRTFKSSNNDKALYFTLPFTLRENDGSPLQHDRDTTKALLTNLAKSIRMGSTFALKSLLRVRCIGAVTRNRHFLHTTLRFEAFLPDVSFNIVQMNLLPLQATTLTTRLLQSEAEEFSAGYLTLTQIRRVVLLEDTDVLIGSIPIVGVWVSFPISIHRQAANRSVKELLEHPLVWTACVRFLYTEKIQDRAFADANTFLLVLLIGGEVMNFEVTPGGAPSLQSIEDFACLDFTLDISGDDADPLICNFKPVVTAEHVKALSKLRSTESAALFMHRSLEAPPSTFVLRPTHPLAQSVSVMSSSSSWSQNQAPAELKSGDDYNDPIPRNVVPVPLSVASPPSPEKRASLQGSAVLREEGDSHANAVIAAQKEEIAALKSQISELKDVVMSLVAMVKGTPAAVPVEVPVVSPFVDEAEDASVAPVSIQTSPQQEEPSITDVFAAEDDAIPPGTASLDEEEPTTESGAGPIVVAPMKSAEEAPSVFMMEPPSAPVLPSRPAVFQSSKTLPNKFHMRRLSKDKKTTALDMDAVPLVLLAATSLSVKEDDALETTFTESPSIIAIENKYLSGGKF